MEQAPSRPRKVSSMMRSARILLSLLILLPASAQDRASRFFGTYTGRYHCGGVWTDFTLATSPVMLPLGIVDPDAGVNGIAVGPWHWISVRAPICACMEIGSLSAWFEDCACPVPAANARSEPKTTI